MNIRVKFTLEYDHNNLSERYKHPIRIGNYKKGKTVIFNFNNVIVADFV